MTKKYPGEKTFGETGEEFRRRIAQTEATIEIDVTVEDAETAHLQYIADEWMAGPKRDGIGGGGSRQRMPKRSLRPLVVYCQGCSTEAFPVFHTSDVSVCPQSGTPLGKPERDNVGEPHDVLLGPDYAQFLKNSKPYGLRIRDVVEFVTHDPRFLNGDLTEWRDAIRFAKTLDRERDFGDRGGPRLFGEFAGVRYVEKLPKSVEAVLRSHGVGFEGGSRLTLGHVSEMGFDLLTEYLGLLRHPHGWYSSPEEVAELTALVRRPDFGDVIAAALFRKQ